MIEKIQNKYFRRATIFISVPIAFILFLIVWLFVEFMYMLVTSIPDAISRFWYGWKDIFKAAKDVWNQED